MSIESSILLPFFVLLSCVGIVALRESIAFLYWCDRRLAERDKAMPRVVRKLFGDDAVPISSVQKL